MTQEAREELKNLNRKFFDDNIKEIVWNSQFQHLVIKMKNLDEFEYQGEKAKDIYQRLVKNSMLNNNA